MSNDFWLVSLKQQNHEILSRSYTEEFHLENGCYVNFCCVCSNTFIGYKRRKTCKLCLPVVVRPQRWTRSDDGKQLFDSDFTYDAKLIVSGDFETDEQRIEYVNYLCERLNKE